jgi:hypothetical protein
LAAFQVLATKAEEYILLLGDFRVGLAMMETKRVDLL